MYSCVDKERGDDECQEKAAACGGLSGAAESTDLVLPVILLGMPQHPVAQPADVSERSVALVSELLQPQHGTIAAVGEGGLEEFENLKWKIPQKIIHNPNRSVQLESLGFKSYLLQDILLSHEFLSFSVGFVNHDFQNILPTVGDVHHKEN